MYRFIIRVCVLLTFGLVNRAWLGALHLRRDSFPRRRRRGGRQPATTQGRAARDRRSRAGADKQMSYAQFVLTKLKKSGPKR